MDADAGVMALAALPVPPARALAPALALMALLALSGCVEAPEVPSDATAARDDRLPGLVLHAWADVQSDQVVLHGLLENDHDAFYEHRTECGHPWHSVLTAPNGTGIPLASPEACQDYYYERLAPGAFVEYRRTLRRDDALPPGSYNWTLAATVIVAAQDHDVTANVRWSL